MQLPPASGGTLRVKIRVGPDRSPGGTVAAALRQTLQSDDYDEFDLLADNAAEWEIPFDQPPSVSRRSFALPSGQTLSYLQWREDEPELVLLHGGAQHAHCWDNVLLALGRPALAVDLPGHGHSDHRSDHDYRPSRNAEAVAALVEARAPAARCVVGMALGGLSAMHLVAQVPGLFERAVLINASPAINGPGRPPTLTARGAMELIAARDSYATFEDLVCAVTPTTVQRSEGNLRRSLRHNAVRLPDGRWTWRFDTAIARQAGGADDGPTPPPWAEFERMSIPTLLVVGEQCTYVSRDDVDEMRRVHPSLSVVTLEGVGETPESESPLIVADLIASFTVI